ncbi:hypothetical protein [Bradyrhizobium sp. SZCCHNR2028]|uniref:hypothetical protein n=1 Tax=Bradyrhizobium sp. SZCCHNR2028 TaxID=3057382 RepID=UPI0028E43623|nr:hypothetical protein [Bradyrhizobium sp. SZCCHNR2028]
MYDAVADDYCYPGTIVLKNKLDIRDSAELAAFEAEVSDARADEEIPAGDLDFEHFNRLASCQPDFHPRAFSRRYGDASPLR